MVDIEYFVVRQIIHHHKIDLGEHYAENHMIDHKIVFIEHLVVNEEIQHETVLVEHVVIVNEKTEHEMMWMDDLQINMNLHVDL